jgi:hypothetical protein
VLDDAGLRRIARGQSVAAAVGGARALLVDAGRNAVAVAERWATRGTRAWS